MTSPSLSSNFLDPSIILPDESEQLKYILRDAYYKTSSAVNVREIATYALTEIVTGAQLYTIGNAQKFRDVYRKEIFKDTLASGAPYTIPHGIVGITDCLKIVGTCRWNTYFLPIPYVSSGGVTGHIDLKADDTNIYLIVGAALAPSITNININLEYVKT